MTHGPALRSFVENWADGLAQVLESMADARPECRLAECNGPDSGAAGEILWWCQPFSVDAKPLVWVGAPQETWESLGGRTLRAAGLDAVEAIHARNTWLEILGQSLAVLGRSLGESLGREANCENGSEQAPAESLASWYSITITYPDATSVVWVGFAARLLELLDAAALPADEAANDARQDAGGKDHAADSQADLPAHWTRTMDLLLDVELPVSISFGRTQLPMKDVLKLTTGSIVELNRAVTEPVEVLVNQCLVARGEVVVVDGNYGVRIQQIISRQERLRSLR